MSLNTSQRKRRRATGLARIFSLLESATACEVGRTVPCTPLQGRFGLRRRARDCAPYLWLFPAFTLIELLVVVAVIAILAALLLPALQKAKRCGQSASCLNNQKQLQLAWQMYHEEHNDRLVPNFEDGTYGIPTTYRMRSNSWLVDSALTDWTTAGILKGMMWPYTKNERIYRCSSDKTLWPYGAVRAPRPCSFALSIYMNGCWNGSPPRGLPKFTEVRQPARCFTFIDEEETLAIGGAFVLNLAHTNSWWTVPGFRDRGCGANVAFADGHVEFHKWKHGRVRTGGETQVDLQDLLWLLDRVPGTQ